MKTDARDELKLELTVLASSGGLAPPVGAVLVVALPCLVGRAPPCDLLLLGDRVARRHARLTMHAGALTVMDLASEAGVVVDGLQGKAVATVVDGGVLEIGNFTLRARVLKDGATPAP